MADSAKTRNVFLDTEVFDRHVHGYAEGNLERIAQLSALADVKLLMTTITEREVRAHLEKDAKNTVKQLKTIKRLPRTAKKHIPTGTIHEVEEQTIRQELFEDFDKFCNVSPEVAQVVS